MNTYDFLVSYLCFCKYGVFNGTFIECKFYGVSWSYKSSVKLDWFRCTYNILLCLEKCSHSIVGRVFDTWVVFLLSTDMEYNNLRCAPSCLINVFSFSNLFYWTVVLTWSFWDFFLDILLSAIRSKWLGRMLQTSWT